MLTMFYVCQTIQFYHQFFTPLNAKKSQRLNDILLAIEEHLNEDCIREVLNHLSLLNLVIVAEFSDRFNSLVVEIFQSKFKHFEISSSTFDGKIGILNFHHFLELFGKALMHFSFSLRSIRSVIYGSGPGFRLCQYSILQKYAVIHSIVSLTGDRLETLSLDSFYLSDQEKLLTNHLFKILDDRNVKVCIT